MYLKLNLPDKAEEQIREIAWHIAVELRNPDAAENLMDSLGKEIGKLGRNPEKNFLVNEEPWRSEEIRWKKVRHYLVYFWVDGFYIDEIMMMLKKIMKVLGCVILILAAIVLVLCLVFKYEMSWRITNIGEEKSPDGRYSALFQTVGEADWPFGASRAKVTVKDEDRVVKSFRQDIFDDGGQFRPANYAVEWMKYGVIITFMGSEQPDREVEVFYDGRDSFVGYSDEEIEDILKSRDNIYNVEKISKDKDGYAIRGDGIDFRADTSLAFHDSYPQEVFKAVTDELFPERFMRSLDWDIKKGVYPSNLVYTPIISMNGPGSQDLNSYCDDICEWLDCCFERLPYGK